MTRTSWYRTALVGALILVLTNTWLASRALHTLVNSQFWLSHTLEVISDTQHMVASVRTAESAARGYILTSSDSFVGQFEAADQQIQKDLEELQYQTRDNASQQVRVGELRLRIVDKMNVLRNGMAVRRNQPLGSLDPEQLTAVVQDTPDRVRSVQMAIQEIEAEENRLLVERTANSKNAQRQVRFSFVLAFVLDFVLLVAAFELLIRVGRDRERIALGATRIESLNGELTQMNTALEVRVQQRTRELQVSNQELEAFSYSVSHDLRAPLRTIDGFSLALLEDFSDKLNDEGRDYIARVRSGVQRMGTLIDALLQLSRVTRSELQAERVDLSQLATLVFHELQASDTSRSVAFVAEPGVIVHGDPRLLRIALENLMGNAWKFTSKTEGARIEFGRRPAKPSEAEETAGAAGAHGSDVYFIRDNGAGFDMHYVDRLFTAFQRLHGDRDFKGSGIGLATVSRIIRRHHGTIGAEGEPGHGATFFFTLPAGTEADSAVPLG